MEVNTGPDVPQSEQGDTTNTVTAQTVGTAPGAQANANNEGDTFPRSYVEDLRKENADHRTKAKAAEERADTLAERLHTALVAATNRLENPADLPYDAEHLEDADKLNAALDALLADRPYFAKRVVKGDAGQGPRGGYKAAPDWADLFKN